MHAAGHFRIAIALLAAACMGVLVPAGSAIAAKSSDSTSRTMTITAAGVTARVDFDDTDFEHGTAPLRTWIDRSIHIVAGYYGTFPVKNVHIHVVPVGGEGVQGGTTWGAPEALIRVRVGRTVDEDELLNDWVLVHEMVHLALPDLGEKHAWLSEGLATYVEGIARVQAGNQTAAEVWSGLVRSMPKGLPKEGDEGLDRTHTWGRTYWGGALFSMFADVNIRTGTQNKSGLQTALRAIARESGGLVVDDWPIERVLETGDKAVGGRVLQDLYDQMKETPVAPDLEALWKQLGIERNRDSVILHDDAPLANVRDAIMQKPGGA